MVRIDCLIFGYRKLSIDPEDLSSLTSIFIRYSIFSSISDDGTVIVRERDVEKIKMLLSGRMDFSCSEPLGLYGNWLRTSHKGAIISGFVISLILTVLLSSVVWDVRVSGNESLDTEEIIQSLSECGFGIGDFWIAKNTSTIETHVLATNKKIAWININRRGTVAYVRVIERETEHWADDTMKMGYSNVIATADCVIEEITVKRGIAVVKPGDVVRKGDLLIAGILSSESGGGFCYAEGSVIGRVSDTLTVEMDRNYEKNIYSGRKIHSIDLNFFNFSVNIFKIYGNLTNECDIIETEIEYTHLDKSRLPFSITIRYIPLFESEAAEYTDEEIVKLATDRLNLLTSERLAKADLLKIRSGGEFTDDGYAIYSEIVFLTEVGENNDFIRE